MTFSNGSSPGNNGPMIGAPYYRTWLANGTNPSTAPINPTPAFFPGFPMQVGTWYMIHTGIFLGDGQSFFPRNCADNDIFVRIDVREWARMSRPMLEIRNQKGELLNEPQLDRAGILAKRTTGA